VVHLSTAFTGGTGSAKNPANERTPFDLGHLKDPYIDSKREAEAEADAYLKKGVEILLLNPGLLLGKGSSRATLGRSLLRFSSLMARAVPGGATLVSDAGDVARLGRFLLQDGEPGDRHIAGTRSVRYNQLMEQVDVILGLNPVSFYMPRMLALLAGTVTDVYARISGTPLPSAPSVSTIKRMYVDLFVSPEKATLRWGINWTPVQEVLSTSIQWLRENRLM